MTSACDSGEAPVSSSAGSGNSTPICFDEFHLCGPDRLREDVAAMPRYQFHPNGDLEKVLD